MLFRSAVAAGYSRVSARVGANRLLTKAAVQAEIQQVLDWAHAAFPGMQAPLDEGGEWDFQVQQQPELVAGQPRQTVTLSLTGTPQFCEAFRGQFPGI